MNTSLDKFSNVKVLVIGDLMLDRYLWGVVERISPEAPVPVVKLGRSSAAAGGASNVAANVAGLGASAILVGAIGNDQDGKVLDEIIAKDEHVERRLVRIEGRETSVKTRIVAHSQHVVRLDQESTDEIANEYVELSKAVIAESIEDSDIVIVSDYAKGFLTVALLEKIFDVAKSAGKQVIVDPKSKDLSKYKGATVITPNLKEAGEAVRSVLQTPEMIAESGQLICDEIGFDSVLITEGERGMTLFEKGNPPFHLNALAHEVFDTTGAGDTVIASFAVAAASGMSFRSAATVANVSAGIAVGHIGTTVVSRAEIESFIRSQPESAKGI